MGGKSSRFCKRFIKNAAMNIYTYEPWTHDKHEKKTGCFWLKFASSPPKDEPDQIDYVQICKLLRLDYSFAKENASQLVIDFIDDTGEMARLFLVAASTDNLIEILSALNAERVKEEESPAIFEGFYITVGDDSRLICSDKPLEWMIKAYGWDK
jgi:hypothetical protein